MKIKSLIALLERFDPEKDVLFRDYYSNNPARDITEVNAVRLTKIRTIIDYRIPDDKNYDAVVIEN